VRQKEARRLAVEQRRHDRRAERLVVPLQIIDDVAYLIGDAARHFGRGELQRAQLLGRRVGKDQHRLRDGDIERGIAGVPLECLLFDGKRRRELEAPGALEHRGDHAAADRVEEVQFSVLQQQLTRVAAQGKILHHGDLRRIRRETLDVTVPLEVGGCGLTRQRAREQHERRDDERPSHDGLPTDRGDRAIYS